MQRKQIDLMAPVGSYESLMAAIQAGANSVYFGIDKLNMRARSSNNFTIEDLRKIVNICNENDVNTYLTVNTIIYNHELDKMREIIDAAAECGVSAIIATDVAAMVYARKKNLKVHASTQLSISNIEAVEFFSQFCDVMVTARELTLDQVAEIISQIKERKIVGPSGDLVKIEIFVHGALCMAISGKCYLSLHEYYYSANRGSCLQNCRRAYILIDKETGAEIEVDNEYLMSPKDLSTIGFIDKIIDAGVSVLKIEGRARSAEYVKTVVECYSEAISSVVDGTYNEEKVLNWTNKLSTVFNRGFWNGYYLGNRLGEWSKQYGSKATKTKVYLGLVRNYFSKINVAEVKLDTAEELAVGDEIIIIGPTTGVVQQYVTEIRKDLANVDKVVQSDVFSIKVESLVRRGDKLYKLVDTEELKKKKKIIMNYPENRIISFIKRHHVLTLATSNEKESRCCNCFYVYLENEVAFLFTSDMHTKHIQMIHANTLVSGTIVLETKIVGKIRGIQFLGEVEKIENSQKSFYILKYLKRFPFAVLNKTDLWKLKIKYIKMTDNRLGFGKKIIWQREDT